MEKIINYFFEKLFHKSEAVSYHQKLIALSTGVALLLIVLFIMTISQSTAD